ncbi:MAG: hemolysin family protein, partial [Bacteroidia bacterium]
MISDLFLTLLLVLFNGFFVAAEFALVKVRHSQLDLKIQQGSSRAKLAKSLLENLDSYLSASQLGITLASLALGWVGEEIFADLVRRVFLSFGLDAASFAVHSISIPLAFVLLTFIHISLGEQIPKMIGIKFSMQTTLLFSWPLRIFYLVCSPFIWTLNKFSNVILRIFGITSFGDEEVHTEEELRLILTESEEGGAIKPSENELIQNVFDFDDRIVKQIMVPTKRISAIDVEMGRNEVSKKVIDEGFSRLPVYLGDIDNIIGIVLSKDLLKSMLEYKYHSI